MINESPPVDIRPASSLSLSFLSGETPTYFGKLARKMAEMDFSDG